MALDFPTSPTPGQTYTYNGITYYWNDTVGAWLLQVPTVPVAIGNTDPGGTYTVRTQVNNGLNFKEGAGVTITIDTYDSENVGNITIAASAGDTTIAEAAFDQANTVWDSANSNYTFAANTVRLIANSAYGATNVSMNVGKTTGGTYASASVRRALNFIEGTGITIAIVDDADLNTANVTITSTGGDTTIAEAAFDQANTVWDSANTNYTYSANDVMLVANSAYGEANVFNIGNSGAAVGFSIRSSSKKSINFVEGTDILINIDDDPTFNTVNVLITSTATAGASAADAFNKANLAYTFAANNAMLAANSAYGEANVTMNVGNTQAGTFTLRGKRRSINFIDGNLMSLTFADDATLNTVNITVSTSATDDTVGAAAFDQANTVWDSANTNYTYAANNVMLVANSAWDKANTANVTADLADTQSQAAFDQANTVWDSANSNYTFAANTVRLIANSAYGEANVTMNVGNTQAGTFTLRGKRRSINFIDGNLMSLTFADDATLNTVNITVATSATDDTVAAAAFDQANTVWDSANTNYTYAANNVMLVANSAWDKANTANVTADLADTQSQAAFDQANTVWDSANSNYTFAANTVRLIANTAYDAGNTNYTYAANNVMLAANSAYGEANVTMNVGNTQAGTFTLRGKRRSINFIDGNLMSLTFADDATLNTVNITVATSATDDTVAASAFDQANVVWDSANSNYTFAANTVRLIANSAYAAGNSNYTFAANTVRLIANSAYGEANVTMNVGNTQAGTFTLRGKRRSINFIDGNLMSLTFADDATLNTVNITVATSATDDTVAVAAFDQANTVWDSANSNYTYAANNVMLAANSAYAAGNSNYTFAANTVRLIANSAYGAANVSMNVGNTNPTGTYVSRSVRRALNFKEGAGITITIDDDAVLNTANVTITGAAGDTTIAEAAFDQANTVWDSANTNYTYAANDVMRVANIAFGTANVAMNIGNTNPTGTYVSRSVRRALNFKEGAGITIVIDDDPTLNTANVTITGAAGDTTIAEAAFDQANTVWDSANSNYTFAANTVRLIANSAYAAGNTNYTYAANNVMLVANTAYAKANLSNEICIAMVLDGGGSAITTSTKGSLEVPFKAQITRWTILLDQSATCNIDMHGAAYSGSALPGPADSMTDNIGMTVSSAVANQSTVMTNWKQTTINAGNVIVYNVQSLSTATRATISLYCRKLDS